MALRANVVDTLFLDMPGTVGSMLGGEATGGVSSFYVPSIRPIEGAFENATNVYVPSDVKTLLSFGPNFSPPHDLSLGDYITRLYAVDKVADRVGKDPTMFLRGYLSEVYDRMLKATLASPTSMERKLTLMYRKNRSVPLKSPHLLLGSERQDAEVGVHEEGRLFGEDVRPCSVRCAEGGV